MKYYLLNVFTKNNQNGNQLACVFPDKNLGNEEMQRIAREFNFSETVFFNHEDNKSLRIFTPNGELSFAGHPTVGAGWLYHHLHPQEKNFSLQVPMGEISVNVSQETFINFPGSPVIQNHDADLEELLESCNLDFTDTEIEDIRLVNTGPVFLVIPLNTRAALSQATWPVSYYDKSIRTYLVYPTDEHQYSVRMFGITREDPATGSAACALAGYLREVKGISEGKITITQGTEMKRECEIKLRWNSSSIQIGGQVKLWGEGNLLL